MAGLGIPQNAVTGWMAWNSWPGRDGLIRRYRIGLRSASHCHGYEAIPCGPPGLTCWAA